MASENPARRPVTGKRSCNCTIQTCMKCCIAEPHAGVVTLSCNSFVSEMSVEHQPSMSRVACSGYQHKVDAMKPHLEGIIVEEDCTMQPAEPFDQWFAGVPEVAAGLNVGGSCRQGVIPVQHQLWPAEQAWPWPCCCFQQRKHGLDCPSGGGCEDSQPEMLLQHARGLQGNFFVCKRAISN